MNHYELTQHKEKIEQLIKEINLWAEDGLPISIYKEVAVLDYELSRLLEQYKMILEKY